MKMCAAPRARARETHRHAPAWAGSCRRTRPFSIAPSSAPFLGPRGRRRRPPRLSAAAFLCSLSAAPAPVQGRAHQDGQEGRAGHHREVRSPRSAPSGCLESPAPSACCLPPSAEVLCVIFLARALWRKNALCSRSSLSLAEPRDGQRIGPQDPGGALRPILLVPWLMLRLTLATASARQPPPSRTQPPECCVPR